MFLHPPTRAMTKYAEGKSESPGPLPAAVSASNLEKFVVSYRRVAERCNRECENCGKPYLAAPHLRLAVLDPDANLFSVKNLTLLCTTCNREREASLRLTADDVTGIVREAVFRREHNMCIYCDSGELAKNKRVLVSRVDNPDPDDKNDWACSCKTCAKHRGAMSHESYVDVCAQRAFDLWSRLRSMQE